MKFRDHLQLAKNESSCLIIGEVAQSHDGSLGMAHAFIDAIAAAGADAVKFQTHIASAESTPQEPWRVKFSRQDASRFDYWKRMEFSKDQWRGLKQHAEDRGLLFLSSPFSFEAVELLEGIGIKAWKVASGEVLTLPLLDRMLQTRIPLLVSTGMSSLAEIDQTVSNLKSTGLPFAILQCTTAYPSTPEKWGLNLIPFFRERYQCAVGFSDHSGTTYAGLAAAAFGAEVIEVHVTFSRDCFGPDVSASLTFPELRQLVEGSRSIHTALASPIDKDAAAVALAPMRALFTKSVALLMDLPAGTALRPEHLGLRKPGTGLKEGILPTLYGRKLRKSLPAGTLINESDIE